MSGRFAVEGLASKELLTYKGSVLWHDDRHELAFIFEKGLSQGTLRIVELPNAPMGRPFLRLQDHPDMAATKFPLDRDEFRG